MTGISFGIPSMERLVLTEAVRNSVDWLHAETWRPVTSNRMLDPGFVFEDLSDDELWARRHRLAGKCRGLVRDLQKAMQMQSYRRQQIVAWLATERLCGKTKLQHVQEAEAAASTQRREKASR